jgi:hypothetical protein
LKAIKHALPALCIIALLLTSCSSGPDWGESADSPIASRTKLVDILINDGRLVEQKNIRHPIIDAGKTELYQSKKHQFGLGEVYVVTDGTEKVVAVLANYSPGRHMWISNFAKKLWESRGGEPKPEFKIERTASTYTPVKYSVDLEGSGFSAKWVKYSSDPEFIVFALDGYEDALKAEFH